MFLEKLSNLPGVSGMKERFARRLSRYYRVIRSWSGGPILPVISWCVKMGALHLPGGSCWPRTWMRFGLIIVSIEKSGHLKFKSVGGIDSRVLVSKRVRGGAGRESPELSASKRSIYRNRMSGRSPLKKISSISISGLKT